MNIKVIFANPEAGYFYHQVQASHWLVVGNEYAVCEIDRGGWHTSFQLEEVPGQHFNSVLFEEVFLGSLQAAYDEIPSGYIVRSK